MRTTCTFLRNVGVFVEKDYIVRTGRSAFPATGTCLRIDPDKPVIPRLDRIVRAGRNTRCVRAMLAEGRHVRNAKARQLAPFQRFHIYPELASFRLWRRPWREAVFDMFILAGNGTKIATGADAIVDEKFPVFHLSRLPQKR